MQSLLAVSSFACRVFCAPLGVNIAEPAHAVAVNEHRALFPLESAKGGTAGQVIERGFIGANSDVGGGYAGVWPHCKLP